MKLRKKIIFVFLILVLILLNFFLKPVFSSSFSASTSFSNEENFSEILKLLFKLFFVDFKADTSSSPSFSASFSSSLDYSSFKSDSFEEKDENKKSLNNKVYKAQCDPQWRNFPLPLGCTICKAGCGPTSVAMIVSYFKDEVSPPQIVEIYRQEKAVLGCQGSSLADAERILKKLGFQVGIRKYLFTSDLKYVAQFLLPYIKENWIILSLANINGIGHFFVIADIDESGRIWVLDPYYGNGKSIPLLQNNLPFSIYYRVAVPVKL